MLNKISGILREHRIAFFLLAAGFFLCLWNLDNQALWQDEAETAMLARSVLKYGYPRGLYETYLINPVVLYDHYGGYGPGHAWIFHPWLSFYVTALSFSIFGQTTFAARFPFALFGCGAFILIYKIALRLFSNKTIAYLSVAAAICSVQLLLLLRQCRYYAMLVFFVLLIVYLYLKLIHRFSSSLANGLTLSLLFFFHTNHGMIIPVVAWLLFDLLYFRRYKKWERWQWPCLWRIMLLAALTLPWYVFSVPLQHVAHVSLIELRKNFEFSIRSLNQHIFPLVINIPLIFFLKKHNLKRLWREGNLLSLRTWPLWLQIFLPLFVINELFFILLRHRMIRYYIHVFPFYFMLQAWVLVGLKERTRAWIATALFIVLSFTNIFQDSAQFLFHSFNVQENIREAVKETRFYFFDFLYEITHTYEGPVSSIVDYLRKHAKPGDEIKVPLAGEPESIQFYLPEQKVLNARFFSDLNFPDWIAPRDYWVRQELLKGDPQRLPESEAYLNEIGRRYERITLNTFDIVWENRPDDLGYHKFRTVTEGLYPTMIYRRLSEDEYQRRLKAYSPEQVAGTGFDRKPLIPSLLPLD